MGGIFEPGVLFQRLSGAEGIKAEAQSRKNIAEFNAQVQEQQAKAERQRATFAQQRQAKEGARVKSGLTAKLAKAGGLGSLVAEDLAAEQAEELELENLLIGFGGEVAARRALNKAELDRLQGRLAKQRGKSQALAADINFATQLASTGAGGGGGQGSFLTGF